MHAIQIVPLALAAWLLAAAGPAQAQSVGKANPTPGSGDRFWTPERMRDAAPLPLPGASSTVAPAGAARAAEPESVGRAGRPPKVEGTPSWERKLFEPRPRGAVDDDAVEAQAEGSSGFPFTTGRVFPKQAISAYPYRAAGKLFVFNPRDGSSSTCSAAVIAPRLVGTAGHCVYDGAARAFYDRFRFVPAYDVGSEPFCSWDYAFVRTTAAWTSGRGNVPNDADFAILEMNDRTCQGSRQKIGDVTGWLGWQTQALIGEHLHELGYPGNLDGGERMQQTQAQTVKVNGFNAGQFGSDQRGGSSGGPWIRDFGIRGSGNPVKDADANRIVGFTSYGPVATGPRYQGASVLNKAWTDLYGDACNRRAGNC